MREQFAHLSPSHKIGVVIAIVALFFLSGMLSYVYVTSRALEALPERTATSTTSLHVHNHFADLSLQAKAVYVYNLSQNKELYARNADVSLPLASLTKVMTALAVSEVLDPKTKVTIPHYLGAPMSPTDSLLKGEQWSIRDVMTYTLVVSSNDGAEYLASLADVPLHDTYPLSPATSTTIWRMNDLAQHLGLTSMTFESVSGLDLDATHASSYGSARDVAYMLAYAASSSPDLFSGTIQKTVNLTELNGKTHTIHNTDEALAAIPGVILGKTGYTDLAGGNLAVLFEAGPNTKIVAVVLGSTESGRFDDMKSLVEATVQTMSNP